MHFLTRKSLKIFLGRNKAVLSYEFTGTFKNLYQKQDIFGLFQNLDQILGPVTTSFWVASALPRDFITLQVQVK